MTRLRLVEAAQKLIAKKGFADTSVEDITAAAGYTRGAFYSNFASKDDLFIDLLRRDHTAGMQGFLALMDENKSIEEIHAGARELYGCIYKDNEQFMYWTEARLRGVRDARFRAKLNALMLEKREEIARFIDYFFRRAGSTPQIPATLMAMGFMSLVEGITLFSLSSPMDITPEKAESVLRHFVDAMMQLARIKGTPGAAAAAALDPSTGV